MAKHLDHLLAIAPALKKLRYNGYYWSGDDLRRPEEGSVWESLDDIGRALEHARETLEERVITGKCSIDEDHEYHFLEFEGTLRGSVELFCPKTLLTLLPFLTGNFDARHAIAVEDMIPPEPQIWTITDDTLLEWPWNPKEPEGEDTAVSSAIGYGKASATYTRVEGVGQKVEPGDKRRAVTVVSPLLCRTSLRFYERGVPNGLTLTVAFGLGIRSTTLGL
ncbi:hypothetical protein DL98DRAFT_594719 [Cadophora sp. DSE1049]|nr:hypothetical protein DL98DRAFT_594719 [Cadophora sp. DSE1049]